MRKFIPDQRDVDLLRGISRNPDLSSSFPYMVAKMVLWAACSNRLKVAKNALGIAGLDDDDKCDAFMAAVSSLKHLPGGEKKQFAKGILVLVLKQGGVFLDRARQSKPVREALGLRTDATAAAAAGGGAGGGGGAGLAGAGAAGAGAGVGPPAPLPAHVSDRLAAVLADLEAGLLVDSADLLMLADLIVEAKATSEFARQHIRPVVVVEGSLSFLGIERLFHQVGR